MGLNFTPALMTKKVEFPGGDVTVRGLSLQDVVTLTHKHAIVLGSFFNVLTNKGVATDLGDMTSLAVALIEVAPQAAAEAMALAADEPDKIEVFERLPFGLQLEILEAVGAQTFTSDEHVGKVVETVVKVLQGTNRLIESVRGA